jgi:methionyl-tRNA formyltransferase
MKEDTLYEAVVKWSPDAFLVVGWYHMIPKSWRALAPAYGLHASLLPHYSGGAPLVWAIINGETKTGISFFQMDDGVDSGPIVGQAEEPIFDRDTIDTLYGRIEERGLELLKTELPRLASGCAEFGVQDESKRRVFPQRSPKDGWIDWAQDAVFIDRFIRAQTHPYPGAYTTLNGEHLIVWASRIASSLDGPPGTVIQDHGEFRVCCGHGSIRIDAVQYRGEDVDGAALAGLFGVDRRRLGD